MTHEKGHIKGAQQHAEGQQGDKTRARFQEQLHEPLNASNDREPNDQRDDAQDDDSNRDRQRR